MQTPILFSIIFSSLVFTLPSRATEHAFLEEQLPILTSCEPTTKFTTVTRTGYVLSVVSTIYRTRTEAELPRPTPNTFEDVGQAMVGGVSDGNCDMKACAICQMLNECSGNESGWSVVLFCRISLML